MIKINNKHNEGKEDGNMKKHFQIFENYKKNNGQELIYLDNAGSSLTPDSVIQKMNEYYFNYRSNIDRAISKIAIQATGEFEKVRLIMAEFLNCPEDEIIWTSGATAASNILIEMLSKHDDEYNFLNSDDEILTTIFEHHSSLVPLQELAKKKKMKIKFLRPDSSAISSVNSNSLSDLIKTEVNNFDLDLTDLQNLVSEKTKIVSICLVSNVTGQINDIKNIISKIKTINPKVFVMCDMTSAFGHIKIDLQDFRNYIDAGYFSFHKAFGPTGVGVLFLKRDLSRELSPTIFGGGMISHVGEENSDFRSDIKVFEAGTPNIAGVIGAGEAIRFLEKLKITEIQKHNQDLLKYAIHKLQELDFVKLFSASVEKNIGIISLQVFLDDKEIHSHDVAEILARNHIAIRAGHHCAEPLMNYFQTLNGLSRISLHIYNSEKDIDKLIAGLLEVKKVFSKKH